MDTARTSRMMSMAVRKTFASRCTTEQALTIVQKRMSNGIGSGAGKGGGGGGSIREAGGKLGEMGAAKEDEYFYHLQREQLAELKKHRDHEIEFHEEQIKRHQEAIARHHKFHEEHKEKHEKQK